MRRTIIAAALSLALPSCSRAESRPIMSLSALGDTLSALLESHGAAAMRSDPAGAAAIFATDARLMFTGMPDVVGRDSLVALTSRMWPQVRPVDVRFERTALHVFGDTAFEFGTYRHRLQPVGQAEFEDRGRYLLMWARQGDGRWQVVRNISNSSTPTGGG